MIPDIQLAQPHVLWALAALPVIALFFLAAERARRQALDRLLAARLQPRLAGSVSPGRRRLGFALLLAGLALCIVAMARPQWGKTFEETKGRGRDVIFAVDTSRSMLGQDVPPSRLERARFAALDLLAELGGDRVGVIAFAGESIVQAPLTPDHSAVEETIRALDTEAIGQGGSNLSAAIEAANEAFGKGESAHRAMVLFSDGEELEEDALKTAEKYKDRFRIYTVGVGTEAGAPVIRILRDGVGEYVNDDQGKPVLTKLDETHLREIAKLTGGFYLRLQNGPADMRYLFQSGLATMSEKENETRTREVPHERFRWPLLAGLGCLATSLLLGERRLGRAAVAALLLFVASPAGAQEVPAPAAPAPPDPAAEALRAVEAERERRPGVAEIEYNVGCAAFSAGDYSKAATAFSTALGAGDPELKARAAYNLGNALARCGVKAEKEAKLADWNNAIQQYNHALSLDPANGQAKINRDIVQKAIEDLKKKEEEEKKKQEEQKKDPEEKEQQKQNSQQKNGDKQESKDEQQQKQEQAKQEQGKSQPNSRQPDAKQEQGDEKSAQSQPQKPDGKEEGKKAGQKPDGKPQPGQQGDPKEGEPGPGEAPPKPDGQDTPKNGDLKQAGEPRDPGEDQEAAEAAEAAQAAREGRMTEKDARALLQSLRKMDDMRWWEQYMRAQNPQRRSVPGGKDW